MQSKNAVCLIGNANTIRNDDSVLNVSIPLSQKTTEEEQSCQVLTGLRNRKLHKWPVFFGGTY